MKNLKVFHSIFTTIITFTFFAGCSSNIFQGKTYYAKQTAEKILQCLDDDDTNGLKNLLSEETQSLSDIDTQIQAAIEFYQGKTVSHGNIGVSDSVRHGDINWVAVYPHIQSIKTSDNKKYDIVFSSFYENTQHSSKIGMYRLKIINDEGNECIVGELINP